MTSYSDIPQVNALYAEQQQIKSAMALIDSGGTLSNITISPAPSEPGMIGPGPMTSSLAIKGEVMPETMAAIRAQLEARSGQIDDELAALGISQ